jgi:hypothetical protein
VVGTQTVSEKNNMAKTKSISEIDSDHMFNGWLYGGTVKLATGNDVDIKLKGLIHNCYRAGIQTFWSDQGFIGQKNTEFGRKAPEGFFTFEEGYIAYRRINEKTLTFHEIIKKIISENPSFAGFQPNYQEEKPETWFTLSFQDISKKAPNVWQPEKEIEVVRQDLAEERLAKIDGIWQYLAAETDKLIDSD